MTRDYSRTTNRAKSTDVAGGLLAHAAGVADDGSFAVTEVWASRADQAAFMESRLGAALSAGGITAMPDVRWVPALAYHTPGT